MSSRWHVLLVVIALSVVLTLAGQGDSATRAPLLSLKSVTIIRSATRDGFGGSVEMRVRMCANMGPRAAFFTTEWRSVGARVVARAQDVDPLGVDLSHVYPYDCTAEYKLSWAVKTILIRGRGTYHVTIRLRDGYGHLTPPISAAFQGGEK
jgi:hypothetical protein